MGNFRWKGSLWLLEWFQPPFGYLQTPKAPESQWKVAAENTELCGEIKTVWKSVTID